MSRLIALVVNAMTILVRYRSRCNQMIFRFVPGKKRSLLTGCAQRFDDRIIQSRGGDWTSQDYSTENITSYWGDFADTNRSGESGLFAVNVRLGPMRRRC